MKDDRLRLIFTCCHPALASQLADRPDVAPARRAADRRDRPRLPRAGADDGATPGAGEEEDQRRQHPLSSPRRRRASRSPRRRARRRLPRVQRGLLGDERRRTGPRPTSCAEAIRLARVLVELMPDEGEALGLLALLLLSESRRAARVAADGSLVLLADQDRRLWDRALIDEGQDLVRACLRRNTPGPYQIQAAINAVHSDAPTAADTDWRQILALYDQLLAVAPSPVVALNRAVAVAEVDGPGAGLAASTRWRDELDRYLPLPRHPRRPAAPPRPSCGGRRCLHDGDRPGDQRRRAPLPRSPPRRGCDCRLRSGHDGCATARDRGPTWRTHGSTSRVSWRPRDSRSPTSPTTSPATARSCGSTCATRRPSRWPSSPTSSTSTSSPSRTPSAVTSDRRSTTTPATCSSPATAPG